MNEQLRAEVIDKVVSPKQVECEINLDGIPFYLDVAGFGGHLRLTYNGGEKQCTRVWQPFMDQTRWVNEVCEFVTSIKLTGSAPSSWERMK